MEAVKILSQVKDEGSFIMVEKQMSDLIAALQSTVATQKSASDIEEDIAEQIREMARLLFQGHLDARGDGRVGLAVSGIDKVERTNLRLSKNNIKSIFGEVVDHRIGYSLPGHNSLFPKDAVLNLADNSYSYGLHKKLAKEATRGSIDDAIACVEEQTGVTIPKRQALEIIKNASSDFDTFYHSDVSGITAELIEKLPLQILTTDGKGVVMRIDGLRDATREKRKQSHTSDIARKRLAKGEKKNGKRMAQAASTYCIERHFRTAEDIIKNLNSNISLVTTDTKDPQNKKVKKPQPVGKRVWASLEKDQGTVIDDMFNEASRRDVGKTKEWVGLIDGQKSQLQAMRNAAQKYDVPITIIVDIIHVIEYIWQASLAFYAEGSLEREFWVNKKFLMILQGKAVAVASGIKQSATKANLTEEKRKCVDTCADYLYGLADYLKYDQYLSKGYPIATGVIEGVCRHLVKDRMDITGARWGLDGGEAILKLRSIVKSEDFEKYWEFHLQEEYKRNHESKYAEPKRLKNKGLMLAT